MFYLNKLINLLQKTRFYTEGFIHFVQLTAAKHRCVSLPWGVVFLFPRRQFYLTNLIYKFISYSDGADVNILRGYRR